MKSIEVYEKIIEAIRTVSGAQVTEPDIVKNAVEEIKKIKTSNDVKIQTAFCHQKPYAFFVKPDSLYSFKKTELGDLMFVVKFIARNEVFDYRSLFLQVKRDKECEKFDIAKHQWCFYSKIDAIDFKFGNKIYEDGNLEPIVWKAIAKPENFGDYLFIGEHFALDVPLKCINRQYSLGGKKFTFDLDEYSHCLKRNYYYSYPPFPCIDHFPLLDFLSPFGKGNKIEGVLGQFTELIYKKLKMIIDPPEEHWEFWEEDAKGGFGVIEVTFNEE